jgi:hypothetical protein
MAVSSAINRRRRSYEKVYVLEECVEGINLVESKISVFRRICGQKGKVGFVENCVILRFTVSALR